MNLLKIIKDLFITPEDTLSEVIQPDVQSTVLINESESSVVKSELPVVETIIEPSITITPENADSINSADTVLENVEVNTPVEYQEIPKIKLEDSNIEKMMNESPIFNKLYDYQKIAVSKTFTSNKGIICLPTATGKTFCQAAIIADDIVKNPNTYKVYVVNAPRIMLSYQLLREVYGFLVSKGIEARYMFVHSGGVGDDKELEEIRLQANINGNNIPFSEILSGTHVTSIKNMMKKAKAQNLPLIFFSTYNSADKIERARKSLNHDISIVLNDEAQYLVQERFHNILNDLTSPRCYFFTATTVHTPSDKGRGMNNTDAYGNMLYYMTPREAIDLGKMVRPRLHIINTDGVYVYEDYDKSLSKIILSAFEQHKQVLINYTKNERKLKPKILVSVKGTQDIKDFLKSKEYEVLRSNNVMVYAVASNEEIGNDINGVKVKRQDFLKNLKLDGEDINKEIIVLHYDILAEGIDISGFTGILPLRTLQKSKFMQTYGRSSRLDKLDKSLIQSGSVHPHNLDKLSKPYAWIIIPNVVHDNEDDAANITALITELRDYGFKPYEDIVSSSIVNGIPETHELDSMNAVKTQIPNIGKFIQELEAEIESEHLARLSKLEFLQKFIEE